MVSARQLSETTPLSPLVGYEPKTRDDLLLLATDRFCAAYRHSRLSTDQFKEAFYLLINEVTAQTKRTMSEVLSKCAYTPRPVALYLSMESMEIATPMLADSTVLGQLDLMQITDSRSKEHVAVIATRPDLGPTLVRRLRRVGCDTINKALDENYALLDKSLKRDADSLFDLIDRRTKVTAAVHQEVEDLSDAVLAQASISANVQADPVAPATEPFSILTNAQASLLEAAARGGRLPEVDTKEPEPPQTERGFDMGAGLERAAQAGSHQAMAVLMQKHSGISLTTAFQVLSDKSGDTLCVFMRAHSIDEAQANRILMLTLPTIGLSVQNAMRSVRFYHQLTIENSKLAVAQWPRTAAKHEPYLEEGTPVRRAATTSVKAVEWASERENRSAG